MSACETSTSYPATSFKKRSPFDVTPRTLPRLGAHSGELEMLVLARVPGTPRKTFGKGTTTDVPQTLRTATGEKEGGGGRGVAAV